MKRFWRTPKAISHKNLRKIYCAKDKNQLFKAQNKRLINQGSFLCAKMCPPFFSDLTTMVTQLPRALKKTNAKHFSGRYVEATKFKMS